jgi:hypothetical protein
MERNLLFGRVALPELMQQATLKLQSTEWEFSLIVGSTNSAFNGANGL